jgi:hypothetical protein
MKRHSPPSKAETNLGLLELVRCVDGGVTIDGRTARRQAERCSRDRKQDNKALTDHSYIQKFKVGRNVEYSRELGDREPEPWLEAGAWTSCPEQH